MIKIYNLDSLTCIIKCYELHWTYKFVWCKIVKKDVIANPLKTLFSHYNYLHYSLINIETLQLSFTVIVTVEFQLIRLITWHNYDEIWCKRFEGAIIQRIRSKFDLTCQNIFRKINWIHLELEIFSKKYENILKIDCFSVFRYFLRTFYRLKETIKVYRVYKRF